MKALHPSDPLTEVRGIPDMSSMPTTLLNWQTDTVISPAAGATGTWSVDLTVMPDPAMFGRWTATDSVGVRDGFAINGQLGTTYADAKDALIGSAERWRLAYAGVTIYQDGPALSDQGTVVVAQVPVEVTQWSVASTRDIAPGNSVVFGGKPAIQFQGADAPDYQSLVRMPNAYFSQSKFGAYIPLKLSTNHQKWHSVRDNVLDASNVDFDLYGALTLHNTAAYAKFPYGSRDGLTDASGLRSVSATPDGNIVMDRQVTRFSLMNENWAHACFQNMSTATRLVCYFRFGVEIQALPQSPFSPYLKLSPQYDPAAIEAYFRISREMKDAYPADYNDLGKLWSVIKTVARHALPVVGSLGPIGKAVASIGSALVGGDRDERDVAETVPRPTNPVASIRDRPPAAAVEAAQERRTIARLRPRASVRLRPRVRRV